MAASLGSRLDLSSDFVKRLRLFTGRGDGPGRQPGFQIARSVANALAHLHELGPGTSNTESLKRALVQAQQLGGRPRGEQWLYWRSEERLSHWFDLELTLLTTSGDHECRHKISLTNADLFHQPRL